MGSSEESTAAAAVFFALERRLLCPSPVDWAFDFFAFRESCLPSAFVETSFFVFCGGFDDCFDVFLPPTEPFFLAAVPTSPDAADLGLETVEDESERIFLFFNGFPVALLGTVALLLFLALFAMLFLFVALSPMELSNPCFFFAFAATDCLLAGLLPFPMACFLFKFAVRHSLRCATPRHWREWFRPIIPPFTTRAIRHEKQ